MKNAFLLTLFAFVTAFAISAMGAPQFVQTLTTTLSDGGSAAIAAPLNGQNTYHVECAQPGCFRTSNDAGLAVCGTDQFLIGFPTSAAAPAIYTYTADFQSASSKYLRVTAVDGGLPACNVFLQTQNLPR